MPTLDYRFGLFALVSAAAGGFLVVADIAETPYVFENARVELALLAPLAVWLLGRRFHLWRRSRF